MASHVYHDDLPGYDTRQILHDGCPECEHRGADVELALAHLDSIRFGRAWSRAIMFSEGTSTSLERVGPVSRAEAPLLRTLFAVRQHLLISGAERIGVI